MLWHKLSQIDQQYPCSVISLFIVLYETRSNQHNYFLYYRPYIIDPFTFKLGEKNNNQLSTEGKSKFN